MLFLLFPQPAAHRSRPRLLYVTLSDPQTGLYSGVVRQLVSHREGRGPIAEGITGLCVVLLNGGLVELGRLGFVNHWFKFGNLSGRFGLFWFWLLFGGSKYRSSRSVSGKKIWSFCGRGAPDVMVKTNNTEKHRIFPVKNIRYAIWVIQCQ